MNITYLGHTYRVTTEQELLLLLGALAMLQALACGKAA
jgi:hypothetical protein